jgi:hypothetical protein
LALNLSGQAGIGENSMETIDVVLALRVDANASVNALEADASAPPYAQRTA